MNDIYNGFKTPLIIELIKTRLEKLSKGQIDELYKKARDCGDGKIVIPKPKKKT